MSFVFAAGAPADELLSVCARSAAQLMCYIYCCAERSLRAASLLPMKCSSFRRNDTQFIIIYNTLLQARAQQMKKYTLKNIFFSFLIMTK